MITYRGTIKSIIHYNAADHFCAAAFELEDDQTQTVTITGKLLNPQKGTRLEITGEWTSHPRHGRQLNVTRYDILQPESRERTILFLGSGFIKGIGPSTAAKIVDRFGDAALEVLDKNPRALLEVPGIGAKKIAEIVASWREHRELSNVLSTLQQFGISPNLAIKIYSRYKHLTIPIITANPYQLAEDIWGVGFLTADKIATKVGFFPETLERVDAGVLHILSQAADNGHVCLPVETLSAEAEKLLGVSAKAVAASLERLIRAKKCVKDNVRLHNQREAEVIYLAPLFYDEIRAIMSLRRIAKENQSVMNGIKWSQVDTIIASSDLQLTKAQVTAIERAVHNKISLLGGGPGTGKSTSLKTLVCVCKAFGKSVLLVSPTGRAAKRLSQATGCEASTVHRALGYDQETGGFLLNEQKPLEADVIIVDESSMLDIGLAASLFRAVRSDAHLVLVGDPDQLPSVGPGSVLRDLLKSQAFPTTILTEVKRQSTDSAIISNAHRINRGELPIISKEYKDFFFLQVDDAERVPEIVAKIVKEWAPANFGFDPIADIQVLAPMKKGPAGLHRLNTVLRDIVNPPPRPEIFIGGTRFRLGDKVMQIRNSYTSAVFNGDIGQVIQVNQELGVLKVQYDDGRIIGYELLELDQLVSAYAISIHKSQGSEFPAAVVVLDGSHQTMLQRNLLYTAVTRAKKIVCLVGTLDAVRTAVQNSRETNRFTGFYSRLQRFS